MQGTLKGAVFAGFLGLGMLAFAEVDEAQRTPLASEAGKVLVKPSSVGEIEGRWQLRRGLPVHTQLLTWAERSGWTLTWKPRVSWLVAADVEFNGNFEQALADVVEGLFFEGKPVRLVMWEGNRLAEVVPSDVL